MVSFSLLNICGNPSSYRFTSVFKNEIKLPRGSLIDLSKEQGFVLQMKSKYVLLLFFYLYPLLVFLYELLNIPLLENNVVHDLVFKLYGLISIQECL